MPRLLSVIASLALVVGPAASLDARLLSDSFDTVSASVCGRNNSLRWTVSDGACDLGGTEPLVTAPSIVFIPGIHMLNPERGGQRCGYADTLRVVLGSLFNESLALPGAVPRSPIDRRVSISDLTPATLIFESGSGNVGAIFDNVTLGARSKLPEPAGVALLGLGLACLGLIGRRASRKWLFARLASITARSRRALSHWLVVLRSAIRERW